MALTNSNKRCNMRSYYDQQEANSMLLQAMSDAHIIAAHAGSTDLSLLENELMRRLEKWVDAANGKTAEDIAALLAANPASVKELAAMLELLADYGICDAAELEKKLNAANGFQSLASTVGGSIKRFYDRVVGD
jgi:hypothetical protein